MMKEGDDPISATEYAADGMNCQRSTQIDGEDLFAFSQRFKSFDASFLKPLDYRAKLMLGAWNQMLEEYDVDLTAQRKLFLLASHSEIGFKEANSLAAKLLAKDRMGQRPANPSAFVSACADNARKKIDEHNYLQSKVDDQQPTWKPASSNWWNSNDKWHGGWNSSSSSSWWKR